MHIKMLVKIKAFITYTFILPLRLMLLVTENTQQIEILHIYLFIQLFLS